VNRNDVLNFKDPPNSAVDQLINACIMSGLSFFTTLASLGAVGLLSDPKTSLTAALISAGLSWFSSLAIQRGLVKRKE